jgi:hypothetical protein
MTMPSHGRSVHPANQAEVISDDNFQVARARGLASAMFPAIYAEAHCPGNVASIRPHSIENFIIVVQVMLNDGDPFDFVLDTPAQVTTIDPELAGELHLKLLGQGARQLA